jgi:hypothetical protein
MLLKTSKGITRILISATNLTNRLQLCGLKAADWPKGPLIGFYEKWMKLPLVKRQAVSLSAERPTAVTTLWGGGELFTYTLLINTRKVLLNFGTIRDIIFEIKLKVYTPYFWMTKYLHKTISFLLLRFRSDHLFFRLAFHHELNNNLLIPDHTQVIWLINFIKKLHGW